MTERELAALNGVLDEIEGYLEDRQDVRDGSDGAQLPNTEMSLLTELRWWRFALPKAASVAMPRETLQKWIDAIEPFETEGSYNNDGVIRTVMEMGTLLTESSKPQEQR